MAEQTRPRGKYWCIVRVDFTEPGLEEEFNDWYTNEHIPELLRRPGIYHAWRLSVEPAIASIGESGPKYLAVWEIEDPSAFDTEAFKRPPKWGGRWQPYIANWTRVFYRVQANVERPEDA